MLTPEEERASQAVRALSTPPADAAFRARLKREFASGAIARAGSARGRCDPRSRRGARCWAGRFPVAAAAALLVVAWAC
jgi:hypothetical protein